MFLAYASARLAVTISRLLVGSLLNMKALDAALRNCLPAHPVMPSAAI